LQTILRFDDGKEIVIDHLRQGCCFGVYSIIEPSPIIFSIKAKTHIKVQILDYSILEDLRLTHPDLDKALEKFGKYTEEYGSPICDYSIPYKTTLKSKFKNAVRRAIAFNTYKFKKKSKLTRLIVELKKQKIEWEVHGEK
jgi:hypothetical protein